MKKEGQTTKGFSLTEIVISIAIFIIIAGVGVGAYLNYYITALQNSEADRVVTLVKETRFRALKNATNSNFGVHFDDIGQIVTSFQDTYIEGGDGNIVVELDKLAITDISLNPSPGVTNEILFMKQTGKTQNSGTFTLGGNNFSSIMVEVNEQGLVD